MYVNNIKKLFVSIYYVNPIKMKLHFKNNQQKFTRLMSMNGSGSITARGHLHITVKDIMVKWKDEFLKQNISEAKESVEHIVAYVLGHRKISDIYRLTDKVLSPIEIKRIDDFCHQRILRIPIQYIIQEWDFRDLTLKMSRPVFIPRPETEKLVDIVLNEIDLKSADILLELCCGSGAISLALLKSRTQLQVTAVDKSAEACKLTKENAIQNQLYNRIKIIHFEITSDISLTTMIKEKFDIIVSNPPYVPSKQMPHLQPEILLYEDPAALDGGDEGLDVIKRIFKSCRGLLNYNGKIFLEVDPTHPPLIKSWLKENNSLGLTFSRSFMDFCNKERFVEITRTI